MATKNWDEIGTLRALFETCRDAENGFRTAAGHARGPELKALLEGYADQRARFAAELQAELGRLGTHDGKSGTIAGAAHHGWMGIKAAVTGGSDEALIAECERGEDVAKEKFEEALRQDLPEDVAALVRRQYAAVREAHDRLRALERAAE